MAFLPYPDFSRSAKALDYKRLGKQRLECKQMLRALSGMTKGWRTHTATVMWRGYTDALAHYGLAVCVEWRSRGYVENLWPDIYCFLSSGLDAPYKLPPWFGSYRVHSSHRARLLCKDAGYYRKLGWTELPSESYYWPHSQYDWRRMLGDKADTYYTTG